MDPNSIEKLERQLKEMGGKPIGSDDEYVYWRLPNGIRWPVEKLDRSLVLSPEQKAGKAPLPKKQIEIVVREPSPIVPRPLTPTMPDRVVVAEQEEFMVRCVEETSSHFVNQMVAPVRRRKTYTRGEIRNRKGKSLSAGFIEEANKVFQEKGAAAAQEFIRKKRDLWKSR